MNIETKRVRGRPALPRVPSHEAAYVELAFARDRGASAYVDSVMRWSRTQRVNVLAGRRGLAWNDLDHLLFLVSPGGVPEHTRCYAAYDASVARLAWLRFVHDGNSFSSRLRQTSIDGIVLRGTADVSTLRRLRHRLYESNGSEFTLGHVPLRVRYWPRKGTRDKPIHDYAYNFSLRARDGVLIARVQMGLINQTYINHPHVRVLVTGQGAARRLAPTICHRLFFGLVSPEKASVDVDVAFDFDAPVEALMIANSLNVVNPSRKLKVYRSHPDTIGGNMELGARGGRVSIVLYDKLRQLQAAAAKNGEVLRVWPPEVPSGLTEGLTRYEIRLAGVKGLHRVDHELRRAVRRFRIADLRLVVLSLVDEVLILMARAHGLVRASPWSAKSGFGHVIYSQLRRAYPEAKARQVSSVLQSRALSLVEEAARRSGVDLEASAVACWGEMARALRVH